MTLISTKSGLKGCEVERMAFCQNDSFCEDWDGRAFDRNSVTTRHVNLSVLCLTYQVLDVGVVCLFCG
jgi:hypothetical protein